MNILITGGRGFIGRALSRKLRDSGHNVVITTRKQSDSEEELTWNTHDIIPPETMSRFTTVVNLVGEPVAPARWTEEKKERILSSRVKSTRAFVDSMRSIDPRPKVLISASAIGYYGPHGDEYVTEDTPPASDFLADVCIQWEAEAMKAEEMGVRVVLIRIGGVLESDGGALPAMAIPFRFFVGGPIGQGKQWFSWIHRDDVVGMIHHALENKAVSGPLNATAPNPVTNREFSTALGRALHRPSCFTVPGFVVKLTLGELGSVMLTGQRVIPEKALKAGYRFKFSDVNDALKAIYSKN
jgi:uncharacterized protein (TIGR01777 family)